MKNIPRGVDLRVFQSRLGPLQRQLDIQLQAARCSLAVGRVEAASLADQVHELREAEAEALAAAVGVGGRSFDPGVHPHALHYCVGLAHARHAREEASDAAVRKVRDQMTECVERDRKLAVVQRLQDGELSAHAALAARRQSREADLEWLARTQRKARQ